jgi:hypothetical protein
MPGQASETVEVTPAILKAVQDAKTATLVYKRATNCGRKFGITGEVGEILVCHTLGLRLVKHPRSEGYDAIDGHNRTVQIKTRRSEKDDLPADAGRTGTFSEHPYFYALLALLDRNYEFVEVWKADYDDIEPIIKKHKRRNPTLKQFKRAGKMVYPKSRGHSEPTRLPKTIATAKQWRPC